ncbi:DMT family transporter, partial [Thermodesulfobacteriota bacterium]
MGGDWPALDSDYKLGVLFGLLAALVYSCYLITLRMLQSRRHQISPLSIIAMISLCTTVLLAVQMGFEGESFVIPDNKSWISLISYGFIGQVLGWVLISRGIAKVDASRVGLVLLLQPSLSFVWDIIFFHRPAGMIEILGCILAITAIYMGSVTKK